MAKIAVIPGIFAGNYVTRALRKALERSGHKVVSDTASADIVLAHSAGCFWLPPADPKQTVILIDPLYWPGKSVGERARSRARSNAHFRDHNISFDAWLARNLWGTYYAMVTAPRTIRIIRQSRTFDLPSVI